MADEALVAGEQARNLAHAPRRHGEQAARHVQRLDQRAGPRHVHAVVITRRQVDVGEPAVGERRGGGFITQQFGRGEMLALGLENAPALNPTYLADLAVGRHQQDVRIRIGCTCARLERAGEEMIEALVAFRVRIGGLAHVHVELADHQCNQPVLERPVLAACRPQRQARQQPVRQHVLEKNGGAHGRDSASTRKSLAMAAASSGGRIRPARRPCASSTTSVAEWSIV